MCGNPNMVSGLACHFNECGQTHGLGARADCYASAGIDFGLVDASIAIPAGQLPGALERGALALRAGFQTLALDTSAELLPAQAAAGLGVGRVAELEGQWARGTFPSEAESMEAHFAKHGAGRSLTQYTDDAARFWETNRGQAQWGKWKPHWDESYRLKVGTQSGYYTRDGRILTYWDD
jgi:hypothetical protein